MRNTQTFRSVLSVDIACPCAHFTLHNFFCLAQTPQVAHAQSQDIKHRIATVLVIPLPPQHHSGDRLSRHADSGGDVLGCLVHWAI
jgi:hypothetical protein